MADCARAPRLPPIGRTGSCQIERCYLKLILVLVVLIEGFVEFSTGVSDIWRSTTCLATTAVCVAMLLLMSITEKDDAE